MITRIIWIAIAWFGSLFWIYLKRSRAKETLASIFGNRVRQGAAILVIICIATSFAIVHETMYAGNLQWGVEAGDQFSYSVIAREDYGYGSPYLDLNDSIIVFEITSLPDIPVYCDRAMFLDLVVDCTKVTVAHDNGSSLDSSISSDLSTLFSNSLLPMGDWWFINGLFSDHARGGLGAPVQDPWFSRFEGSVFCFGEIQITCVGAPGWDADISMDDGVPYVVHEYPSDWGEPLVTLTRIA
ncbi:MAG: hypothetical protein ACFFFK_05285 [Candidatus Thorarchaeota archaeon]